MTQQKTIGPTFPAELKAAGVFGGHFSWFPDGTIEFFGDTPPEVQTAVEAVYTAHDPSKADPTAARAQRSALLRASDWSQMPDSPLAEDVKAVWRTYRQALRDVSSQPGFPETITWPVTPQ